MTGWHIKVLPPALEPVTMLIAFGLGLGAYVTAIEWRGREVSYLSFVAPGMLAYAAFMTPFFQALYAAFIRMHYQRTWEGQLTTQIEMHHVVWGEILWAAVLGTVYLAVVITALAYLVWNWALERVPAPRAAVFLNAQPATGALLGVLVLGETLTVFTAFGAALIVGGLSLTVRTPPP
jgi:drug/metabolite transporter (DMT)-like permease